MMMRIGGAMTNVIYGETYNWSACQQASSNELSHAFPLADNPIHVSDKFSVSVT